MGRKGEGGKGGSKILAYNTNVTDTLGLSESVQADYLNYSLEKTMRCTHCFSRESKKENFEVPF